MSVKDKVGTAWHETRAMYDKVGTAWRPVLNEWVKVGGVWRKTFYGAAGVYFEEYTNSMNNLLGGSYSLKADDSGMTASLTNAYTGGTNLGCQIGWKIKNLPAGAVVDVGCTYTKQAYPMNDIVVSSENGVIATRSEVGTYSFVLSTEHHTGWILFMINFFPYSTTSTSLTITSLTVNGERLWTAVS